MDKKDIKVAVGLGNTDRKYDGTYHNVGVFALGKLKELAGNNVSGIEEFVALPGFMNQSGLNLFSHLRNSNFDIENCLIIHDDSDLLLGEYKISFGKNAAGQRGVQNIIDQFGTKDFWRLRIGIRDPKEQVRKKAGDFVLKQMSASDKEAVSAAVDKAFAELSSN